MPDVAEVKVPVTRPLPVTLADSNKIRQIIQIWGDTFDKNLRVGLLLDQLKPSKKHWNDYGLPFTYSWGRRLIKIAKDERIAAHRSIMPGARAVLHKIACLSNNEFAEAVKPTPDGATIIHPAVGRHDIDAWLRWRRGTPDDAELSVRFRIRPGRYPLWEVEDHLKVVLRQRISADSRLRQLEIARFRREGYRRPMDDLEE